MVGRLLLLGFLYLGGQLLVLGGLRPLHAIDGTVEATGSEASTGLGFGFEGHVSGRSLAAVRLAGIAVTEGQRVHRF